MLDFKKGNKFVCISTLKDDNKNDIFTIGHLYECEEYGRINIELKTPSCKHHTIGYIPMLENILVGEKYYSLFKNIYDLENYSTGRPGFNEIRIPKVIINNSLKFLSTLIREGIKIDDNLDIRASNFCTVCFDFYAHDGEFQSLINVEIGKSMIGWFTEWVHGINTESDGMNTDFMSIPQILKDELMRL